MSGSLLSSQPFKQQLRQKAFEFRRRTFATMPSATNTLPPSISQADLTDFTKHLANSTRILALCGAGLSASSGLPTFRGAGGYWRNNDATALATPEAFSRDPGLVWQFYSYRRHMSIRAAPNRAHLALAELARRKPHFLTITQNVDGLSQRAAHPSAQIEFLHGSLSTLKCTSFDCDYVEHGNFEDPIAPALALPHQRDGAGNVRDGSAGALPGEGAPDISDAAVPLRQLYLHDLPRCPKCEAALLRPGVVWFGEALPSDTLGRVDGWMGASEGIDLLLVIGTSAVVYPAAGYIHEARSRGARVAIVNMESREQVGHQLQAGDWFFQGDAGSVVPTILESVIGDVEDGAGKL